MFKKTLIAIAITSSSGCLSTASSVYSAAKATNDVTFKAAIMRICSPAASLSATRVLSEEAIVARSLLCEEVLRNG